MEKQKEICGSQKPCEANQPHNVKPRKRDQTTESQPESGNSSQPRDAGADGTTDHHYARKACRGTLAF